MSLQPIYDAFPDLTAEQRDSLEKFSECILDWNSKINLIARSDTENIARRHILHSLAIAKVISFRPNSRILDVGTGGGFPGIPLAILFPDTHFHLIDSIGKKIKVVKDIVETLGLKNVTAEQVRAEQVRFKYDFVVARAVTQLPKFMDWIRRCIAREQRHELENGVLYLKGGDLEEEFDSIWEKPIAYDIKEFFDDEMFDEKYVVYIPVRVKRKS